MATLKHARGTCPRCDRVIALDHRGRIPEHVVTNHGDAYTCRGMGRRPLEALIPEREKARAKRMAEVDKIRSEAAVLLDAYLSRRSLGELDDLGEQLARFYELAFQHYRVRYPRARPEKCGYSWNRTMKKTGYVNCFCVFCGDFLGEMPVAWKVKDTDGAKERWEVEGPRMERHATECALMVVAGLREPVPPGTRNLPNQEMLIELPLLARVEPGGAG